MKKILPVIIALGLLSVSASVYAENSGKIIILDERTNNTTPNIYDMSVVLSTTTQAPHNRCLAKGVPISPTIKRREYLFGEGQQFCNPPNNPVRLYQITIVSTSATFTKEVPIEDNTNCTITTKLVNGSNMQHLLQIEKVCPFLR